MQVSMRDVLRFDGQITRSFSLALLFVQRKETDILMHINLKRQ